jgi:hypothetical protein
MKRQAVRVLSLSITLCKRAEGSVSEAFLGSGAGFEPATSGL